MTENERPGTSGPMRGRRLAPLWRLRGIGGVILALGLASGASAQGTPGSRVLVMPFDVVVEPESPGGAGATLWMGEAASILLVEHLSALGVGTLTRDQRVLAFDRLELPMSAGLTRATMLRVGELIDATEIVFGELHVGARLRVQARLVGLRAGRELVPIAEQGPLEAIFDVFSRVASGLAAQTGRVQPPGTTPLSPLPLEVFEEYVKGLVAPTLDAQQRFLERAVQAVPGDARIRMALWRVYSELGQHEGALASASTVPPGTALSRTARFAVALSLLELGRLDGAFQVLTDLYASGRSAAVSNALGVVQLRRPDAAASAPAASYFGRAAEEDPENTAYLFNLGYALARTGESEEALTWLREVVRLDAANGDAHLVMSTLLAASGRMAEARRELELAALLGTSPGLDVGTVSAVLPDRLEWLPNTPDVGPAPRLAAVIANPAQRDQAETAAFHLANGKQLIADQRDREAIDELRRAIYLAPYDHEPHLLLGEAYHRVGQVDKAVDELKVAVWCRETAAARIALARALFDSGELEAAETEVERAGQLAPNSAEVAELRLRLQR